MVKGLVIGDRIIPSDSVLSIDIVQSSLTKNYQVLLKQLTGITVLFVSPSKATAKKVYDGIVAALYEPADISQFITPALSHTVKIYDGVSVLKTETVQDTDSWTIPDLTKEGHTLEGVYTDQAMAQKDKIVGGKIAIYEDTNLYSKWNINQYNVTFDVDGGSNIPAQKVNWGGKATKPAQDPTKADNTFAGYFKDSSKSTEFNFSTEVIKANTTIYVKWTPTPASAADSPQNDAELTTASVPHVKKTRTRKVKPSAE